MGKFEMSCDCNVIHEDVVKKYKRGFSTSKFIIKLSDFFKLLSDNTRISILTILDQNEVCVCDIASILNMTKSAVSHQLAVLKDAGLLKSRRNGKEIYYSFTNESVKDILEIAISYLMDAK